MIPKFSFQIAIILLSYILQTSFVLALPEPLNFLSIPLIMIIITTYVFGLGWGFLLAASLGALFDHDSNFWFASTFFSFFATILVIKILSDNVFTNRSLYSCAMLSIIGTVFQVSFFHLINFNYYKNNIEILNFLSILSWETVLNLAFASFIFTSLIFFYKGLKSYILIK